ncbi:MAG: kinase [Desulfovibrionaceae bacterium]|nr:kinase [Desulfovibrionaceae bacterium]MBF0512692.1 kinase [Desulfovibrionaceae bacterium]
MVICRTPYRISFFGGGSDYPAWYRIHGGQVLATAINKYCYITCRYLPPFFEHYIRIVYSRIENARHYSEIKHPAVRETLRFLNFERGLEIHHDGDLPARSGMGSSSSFTVGLLHALYALSGKMPDTMRLAQEAIHVEQNLIQEVVGSQDQVSAALGGFNRIRFQADDSISVEPMTLRAERRDELNDRLMLMYTGIKRTASDVAKSYTATLAARETLVGRLSEMVDEAVSILHGEASIDEFGRLLHEAWMLKRSLSNLVSSCELDEFYDTARAHGAIGGKILGAGGGGFILLFAPPGAHKGIRRALNQFIEVPFKFEPSGSRIIFFEPQREDFASLEKARKVGAVQCFKELDGLCPAWEEAQTP